MEEEVLELMYSAADADEFSVLLAAARRDATVQPNRRYPSLPLDGYREQKLFHQINLDYPGLQLVHEQPYIFVVNSFLSPAECEVLKRKARGMTPQQSFQPMPIDGFGVRSSRGRVLHVEETPLWRERVSRLTNTLEGQLEPLKVSMYGRGASFGMHEDSLLGPGAGSDPKDWNGDRPRVAEGFAECPFPGANRICTLLVYLNTVESGGRTRWRWLKQDGGEFYSTPPRPLDKRSRRWTNEPDDSTAVNIAPEQGMAVLHFPATTPETGGFPDRNSAHEAEEAGETKLVAQQFIYSRPIELDALPPDALPPRGSKPDLSCVL